MAEAADQVFSRWSGRVGTLGSARALKLVGIAYALEDQPQRALRSFDRAIKLYKERDPVRAAETEALAAASASRAEMRERALSEAKRSRSRFYHAGDVFACAQTELELSQLYARYEMPEEATQLVEEATLRMSDARSEVGANRAALTAAIVAHRTGSRNVPIAEARALYERAVAQRDGWGEVVGASALLLFGAALEPEELERLGAASRRGRRQLVDTAFGQDASRALASACAQGYGAASPRVERDCAEVVELYAPEARAVRRWIAAGYGDLLRGLNDQARAGAERIEATLSEETDPEIAAEIELYLSALARAEGDQDRAESLNTSALERLSALDEERRPGVAYRLATELTYRGQPQAREALLKLALQGATARSQGDLLERATLEYIETLRLLGRFDEADRLASELVTAASQRDAFTPARARAAFELALIKAGRGEDDEQAWAAAYEATEALQGDEALTALLFALEASLKQPGGERAQELGVKIEAIERGLPEALTTSLEGKRLRARSEALRATQRLEAGDLQRALELAESAQALVADDPAPASTLARARALALLAQHGTRLAQSESATRHLEELWARQLEALKRHEIAPESYRAPVAVARALAEARYARGDAEGALEVFEALLIAGLAPTQEAESVACERGRLLMVSDQRERGRVELNRCVAFEAKSEAAYRAALMRALSEDALGARVEALKALGPSLSARERARLAMLERIAAPKAPSAAQSKADKRLEADYADAAGAAERVARGEMLLDVLLERGKVEQARDVLRELKPLLYELGGEYPVDYVRYNALISLSELDALGARSYLERASAELPQSLEPLRQAKLELTRARVALALGQWSLARELLSRAAALAEEASAGGVRAEIDALAAQFALTLTG